METAHFRPGGGSILGTVTCTPPRDGSYALVLWEADENRVVKEWRGNFINADDDSHRLPKPNGRHDGRLLECLAVVSVPGGLGPATIRLTVSQDDRELATAAGHVPPDSPGGLADLFVRLAAAE